MLRAETLNRPMVFWSVIALAAVASLPMRFGGATPDISWLISMCDRILNGEIAYIDIFETTPPTPTLLYMPGVLLSRVTPLSAEAAVYITAYLSTLATLALGRAHRATAPRRCGRHALADYFSSGGVPVFVDQ